MPLGPLLHRSLIQYTVDPCLCFVYFLLKHYNAHIFSLTISKGQAVLSYDLVARKPLKERFMHDWKSTILPFNYGVDHLINCNGKIMQHWQESQWEVIYCTIVFMNILPTPAKSKNGKNKFAVADFCQPVLFSKSRIWTICSTSICQEALAWILPVSCPEGVQLILFLLTPFTQISFFCLVSLAISFFLFSLSMHIFLSFLVRYLVSFMSNSLFAVSLSFSLQTFLSV